jgi:uncharacterized protein YktA (UPF0223 family)
VTPINFKHIAIFALIVLTLGGCQKRYWYRQKIDLRLLKKPYQGTVHVTFTNLTPKELVGDYEKKSMASAYRSFKRIGLRKSENLEKSDYHLDVEIYIDSIISKRPTGFGISAKELQTKSLNIDFVFRDVKNKRVLHKFHHDIFFFDYPARDVGRCAHMVKHSVLNLKDDKR